MRLGSREEKEEVLQELKFAGLGKDFIVVLESIGKPYERLSYPLVT